MTKEIKFRIWDKRNLQWATDFYIIPETGKLWCENAAFIPDDFVIMQYTGLKDANEKEIYEGDLLGKKEFPFMALKVYWNEKHSCFSVRYPFNDTSPLWLQDDKIIIGNIYENQELICKQ